MTKKGINKMIKKIAALTLSFLLSAVCLASCGNGSSSDAVATSAADSSVSESEGGDASSASDASSQEEVKIPEASLTINGEVKDTDGLVMLTVDGKDITFDTFRYYYSYVCSVYGITPDAVTEDNFKDILSNTVNQIKQEYVTLKLAEENNIELNDEDKKKIEEQITSIKGKYDSEEAFQDSLKQYYLTIDVLQQMEEMSALYQKIADTLFANGGKYATPLEDFKKVVQDKEQYARAVHILIPYCSQAELDEETQKTFETLDLTMKMNAKQQAYGQLDEEGQKKCKEEAKKVAEDVLKKALDGEDFTELIKQYGWDPGMESDEYKDGYYIRPESNFVQEFKDAAFKLKEDEITSELVENESYGYFIIKRLPVDMKYVEDHFEMLVKEYDAPKVKEVYSEYQEKMEVTYSDEYNALVYNSIT